MAADMIDMSYTPAERKEEANEAVQMAAPKYPWGLQIRLEKDELEKLKIDRLPGVGTEFHLMAVGRVTAVSQAYNDSSDDQKCVTIQLIMMQVFDEGDEPGIDTTGEENKEAGTLMNPKSVLSYYKG